MLGRLSNLGISVARFQYEMNCRLTNYRVQVKVEQGLKKKFQFVILMNPQGKPVCVCLDQFHFGVGIHGHHIVSLRRLHTGLGVRLAIQILIDEEISSLL